MRKITTSIGLLSSLVLYFTVIGCAHHPKTTTPLTASATSSQNIQPNTITIGLDYDQTVRLIKKHSGIDITSGLALMPMDRKSPLTALYWQFLDYDAVIGLLGQDGKITGMTYWTKADFSHSKAHRAKTEQSITTLRFNPTTKEVSVDKTIVRPATPPSFKRNTNPTNTTNTVSPEFIAQNENAFEKMMEETARCFELANHADIEIFFRDANHLRFSKPGHRNSVTVTEKTLIASVVNMTFKRELAVVILGKHVQYASPEPQLSKKADELEALLRAQGFQRVVFHKNTAFGQFTYRE